MEQIKLFFLYFFSALSETSPLNPRVTWGSQLLQIRSFLKAPKHEFRSLFFSSLLLKTLDELNFCYNTTELRFLEFNICMCTPGKIWNAMSKMRFSSLWVYHAYMYETLSMQPYSARLVSGMVVTSLEVQMKKWLEAVRGPDSVRSFTYGYATNISGYLSKHLCSLMNFHSVLQECLFKCKLEILTFLSEWQPWIFWI